LRELVHQRIHSWRRTKLGSIDPIVESSEHIEDERRQFEYFWMLRAGRNSDRKRRIALDPGSFLGILFDNRPNVVSATQKNDIGVPAGRGVAVVCRSLSRSVSL
jgi:hypothetical protein